jgi:ATP/maltotriose-dependent transcriptional regulator MalT
MDGWETDHNWLETLETSFGLFAAMQGHGDRARDHFDRLKQSATQRGHRLHEGWAEYSIASALINEGQYEAAYHPLDRGRALIVGTGDLQSVHICEGLSARLHWGLNDHSAALRIADSAGKLSKQMRPTNFSSLEAFGAPPLVGALAMLKGGTTAEAGVKLVENYLGPLKRYATVFPSAKPRLATVNAIAAVARKSGNAAALTDKAAEMAERCGMRFEANILSRALPHLASI